jgi:putative transposase
MSELRKTTPDDLYFVTLTVVGWVDLFSRETYKNIIVENLKYCQDKEKLQIFSYVIMSNHLHMVCRRLDKDLKELLGRFKSYTSKLFLKEIISNTQESRKDWLLQLFKQYSNGNSQYGDYHIWDYTDHPVALYSNSVIDSKIEYIHQNPVKSGIVTEAEYYKYSSACFDSPLKVLDL